jgi:nondiscriminating glutamyl-tRNA synthetase
VTVREFREKGIFPEALLNYLSLLGSSLGEGREVCSREEIMAAFSMDRAGKSGAIFDEEKLKWLNGIYIRQSDLHQLTVRLLPFIRVAGYDVDRLDFFWLQRVIDAVRDDLVTLSDIGEHIDIFFDGRYVISKEARQVLKEEGAQAVIHHLQGVLKQTGDRDENIYQDVITIIRAKTGFQGKKLFMPIRAAVTGKTRGPELDKVFSILSRPSLLVRVEEAISDQHRRDH